MRRQVTMTFQSMLTSVLLMCFSAAAEDASTQLNSTQLNSTQLNCERLS